jgi:hypothetical protein
MVFEQMKYSKNAQLSYIFNVYFNLSIKYSFTHRKLDLKVEENFDKLYYFIFERIRTSINTKMKNQKSEILTFNSPFLKFYF